jgi:hypothetical protein
MMLLMSSGVCVSSKQHLPQKLPFIPRHSSLIRFTLTRSSHNDVGNLVLKAPVLPCHRCVTRVGAPGVESWQTGYRLETPLRKDVVAPGVLLTLPEGALGTQPPHLWKTIGGTLPLLDCCSFLDTERHIVWSGGLRRRASLDHLLHVVSALRFRSICR